MTTAHNGRAEPSTTDEGLDEAVAPEPESTRTPSLQDETQAAKTTSGVDETLTEADASSQDSGALTASALTQDELDPTLSTAAGLSLSAPFELDALRYAPRHGDDFEELGRGGIGRVLLAVDRHIGREIAVKELLPRRSKAKSSAEARFVREIRLTGQLEHPNIVPIYDTGKHPDGRLYYTMKLVRGRTLSEAIAATPKLDERLRLLPHVIDVGQALAYAHSRGVLHRDIKSANIMLGEFGETLLLDWGLAKAWREAETGRQSDEPLATSTQTAQDAADPVATADGATIGTPAYMSPEAAMGQQDAIDERTDVWSLGVVLFELLTRDYPFAASSAMAMMMAVMKEEPRQAIDVDPAVPPELNAVLQKALHRDPQQRYQSAKQLVEELERYQAGRPVAAFRYALRELAWRWAKKHRALLLVAGAAIAAISVLGLWSYLRVRAERDSAVLAQQRALAAEHEARDAEKGERKARATAEEREAEVQRTLASSLEQRALLAEGADAGLLAASALQLDHNTRSALDLDQDPGLPLSRGIFMAASSTPRASLLWQLPPAPTCRSLAWLHDGLVCGPGQAGELHLWDDRSGDERMAWGVLQAGVRGLSPSPDGLSLLSLGLDQQVCVWSIASQAKDCSAELGEVYSAAWSSDTGELMLLNRRGELWRWARPAAPKLELKLDIVGEQALLAPDASKLVQQTPQGLSLYTFADARTIPLPNPDEALPTMQAERSRAWAFSPDGGELWWLGAGAELFRWSLSGKLSVQRFALPESLTAPVLSVAAQQLALGDAQGRVWSWTKEDGLRLLGRLSTPVLSLAFSPDGARLAIGCEGGVSELWDARDGTRLLAGAGHTAEVYCANPGEDGRLLSSSADGFVRLIELATGRVLSTLQLADAPIFSAELSADGRRLLSTSEDGWLRLWALSDEQQSATLLAEQNTGFGIFDATHSPDGLHVVSTGEDGRLRFWDAATLAPAFTMDGSGGGVNALVFDGTGELLYTASDDGVLRRWSVSQRALERELPPQRGHLRALALSADGSLLAVGGAERVVMLWDTRSWESVATIRDHRAEIVSLDFSPDGTLLASSSSDSGARIHDVRSGALVEVIPAGAVADLRFLANGEQLLTAGLDQRVQLWRRAAPSAAPLSHGANVWTLSLSHDGKRLLSGGGDGELHVAELGGQGTALRLQTQEMVYASAWSPDDRLVAVGGEEAALRLYSTEDWSYTTLGGFEKALWSIAFSPDGRWLAAGGYANELYLWDLSNRTSLRRLPAHSEALTALAFSDDGTLLLSAGADERIIVWELPSFTQRQVLLAHVGDVTALRSSRDGRRVISGSSDRTLRLWDLKEGRMLSTLSAHEKGISALDWYESEQHSLVASGASDQSVRLWEMHSGELLAVLPLGELDPNSLRFSADGRTLWVGLSNGAIRALSVDALWSPPMDWVETLEEDWALSPDRSLSLAERLAKRPRLQLRQ
ncbi:MAG: protein kinase [Myxococcota bacterium]|jgi:WD40 repeat protein|nr:protein kinase [Myxococcota bacterium]